MRKLLLSLVTFYLLPVTALAADFSLATGNPSEDGSLEVVLLLRASSPVNALQGALDVPADVSIADLADAGSFVQFWIEKPKFADGRITFAGIVPGGFSGEGVVLRFRTRDDPARITIDKKATQALLHDGEGTPDPVLIGPTEPLPAKFALGSFLDTEPPKEFAPTMGQDPALFDGQPFVSFGTRDGGGVVRYQVAESEGEVDPDDPGLVWRDAESPAPVAPGERYVYVRAIDEAGNMRTVVVPPAGGVDKPVSGKRIFLAIITATAIGAGFVLWRKRRNVH